MKRVRLWAIPAVLAAGVLVYVYGFAPETTGDEGRAVQLERSHESPIEDGRQHESLLFHGNDTFLAERYGEHDWPVVIEKTDDGYTMDGMAMEVRRHSNITHEGLSLTIQDRVGEPDMYYVLDAKRQTLALYVNCESGPCTYKRSIRAR